MAYSFGPYVQFWASYSGVEHVGAMAIAMGGMDSVQRLRTISEYSATALLCTPSYALHLANVATRHGLTDALGSVERIVCAGEPGASVPAVRQMIEERNPACELEIDGGVDAATAPRGVQAGANVLVAGSSIFNGRESVGAAMERLRGSLA